MDALHLAELAFVRFSMSHYVNQECQGKAREGAQGSF